MIFAVEGHVEKIKNGSKTMTRRSSDRYQPGKLYTVQECRTCKGIPEGKIYISMKLREWKPDFSDLPQAARFARKCREMEAGCPIADWAAKAEGGYTPKAFEALYSRMYPGWTVRWAYHFSFFTIEEIEEIYNGLL